MAAMGANVILTTSPPFHQPLFSQTATCSHRQSLHSAFRGTSLKFPCQSLSRSLAAASPKKPLSVVAVQKGNYDVEGVVTLTQEDEGVAEATIVDNQIPLSEFEDELEGDLGLVAAVPKKRTSKSKKRIRKNVWKRKAYWSALKAFSLAKSIATGKSKSFWSNSGKAE